MIKIGRRPRFVALTLEEIAKAPPASSVTEILIHEGANRDAQEGVWVFGLDNHKVRDYALLARGEFHRVEVPIPALISIAALSGSHRVVLAHTHPSGNLYISEEDYALTEAVATALNHCGMELVDHLIMVPSGEVVSFTKQGLLEAPLPAVRAMATGGAR